VETVTSIDISSEHDLADIEACHRVGEILSIQYPGHPWQVGVKHDAGTIHIELPYLTRLRTRFPYGFLLHLSSLRNHDTARKKVIWAGGELLERYGLPRGAATADTPALAMQNGLDRSSPV
jgi:hypothetical protein